MMYFNKKQGQFLNATIDIWEFNGTISNETADTLKKSYSIRPFDWKKLAKYSFWIALICGIISFGAIIADNILIDLIKKLFTSSNIGLCVTFSALAAASYYPGLRRWQNKPENVVSNEAIFFLILAASFFG
ncbi:MAG: hypothetical protein WBP08_03570 [Saprospiraceae bacterium]|nr:hypothetical protein [Saprospiraceae bacterium]